LSAQGFGEAHLSGLDRLADDFVARERIADQPDREEQDARCGEGDFLTCEDGEQGRTIRGA
jgi:hypothetical protein